MRKDPHEKATSELMRLRRLGHEKASSRSTSLSRLVLIRKEIQAMDDRHEKPAQQETTSIESDNIAGAELRVLLRDTAVVCRKLVDSTSTENAAAEVQLETSIDALEQAKDVYHRSLLWPATLPPAWQPRVCALTYSALYPRSLHSQRHCYLFTSVQFGAVWVAYFCSKIHLCLSILKATRSIQLRPQTTVHATESTLSATEITKTIRTTVDSIIDASAFLLGDIDSEGQVNTMKEKRALGAFFLLRALDVALAVPMLPPAQQQSLLGLLTRIGTEFGIKGALNRREQWLVQNSERFSRSLN